MPKQVLPPSILVASYARNKPIISPESVFESRFYTRRLVPNESPRFPDSKIVIPADYTGLEGEIVENGSK